MQRRLLAFITSAVLVTLLSVVGESSIRGRRMQDPSSAKPLDLVPVNVYATDRAGKPVTDLKQSDFTIAENGAAQQIRYFAARTLTPGPAPTNSQLAPRTAINLSPQNERVFVIMLGRGRLEDATKAVTSLAAFVRKLLPQDEVAVFAHDRALDFTTDHEKAAQALERFRKTHPDVDVDLDAQLGPTGMAALYGRKALPAKLQTKINEMVVGPGAKVPAQTASDTFEQDAFRTLTLDDFMFATALSVQDNANLRSLLEYLRRFDGEKHLLFVTEKGVDKGTLIPSDENDQVVAEVGSDARTAIHTLHAGGLASPEFGKEIDATQLQTLHRKSLRTLSELTGGLALTMERGGSQLDLLDELTRNG